MYKRTKFFIKNIIRIIFDFIISILTIRNKKILIMGLSTKNTDKKYRDYFMHNTKYLFLYLSQNNKYIFKVVYLCDNPLMINELKQISSDVYSRKSLKGIYYKLRAKYWLYDNEKKYLPCSFLSGGATCINLYHGIPLKKIGYDTTGSYKELSYFQFIILKLLASKDSFYNVNSEYEQSCYSSAFLTNKENIKILGSPRLDVLLNDIPHSDLFMEKDFEAIKNFKEQGKKVFIYTPTFRDTGKDISAWLKSEKLKQFLKNSNAVLVCKLHFADKNSLNFELPKEFYKMDSDSDIYPVLKYSDALITDYSSIYFDYLLLDKPILYYPIDLEEYQEKCRGFYRPYEELTAGIKAYNEDELISAMQEVINGIDNYKEQRKELRERMFKYQDGHNCERVVEWIKSLNEKGN